MNQTTLVRAAMAIALALFAWQACAQTPPPAAPADAKEVAAEAVAGATAPPQEEAVTLFKMIQWGGAILWVTMGLGCASLAMSIYFIFTVTPKREAPPTLSKRLMSHIRAGDLRGAYQLCEGRDELLANVVRAGLRVSGRDRYVIQDAMESEGERGVTDMWQKISYLNNIGVLAPLVGLLGTVWGMVLAFSSIASNNAQVRSLAVASSVSKAMICTVGGLIVAIPSLAVYYYLRGRVVKVIAAVEAQSSEIVELLSRGKDG